MKRNVGLEKTLWFYLTAFPDTLDRPGGTSPAISDSLQKSLVELVMGLSD